jgi:hypothetical protein
MSWQVKLLLLGVVAALSVGMFASTTLDTKPVEAATSQDIYDAHCDQGTGVGYILYHKRYAESFTAGHTGGLTRGFVESYNVQNKPATYIVEIWNADLFGIPTGPAPLASTIVYNPHEHYEFEYPIFSSPARVIAGNNYAMVVTVLEPSINGVVVSPGNICAGTFSWSDTATGAFTAEDPQNHDLNFAVFIDATAPTVNNIRATSTNDTGEVHRKSNFKIIFSEDMKPTTIDTTTIKLYKLHSDGSKTQVRNGTTVSCVADSTAGTQCKTALLNPYGSSAMRLAANSRYRVVVTRGAQDVAGNALKKSFSKTFKTGST